MTEQLPGELQVPGLAGREGGIAVAKAVGIGPAGDPGVGQQQLHQVDERHLTHAPPVGTMYRSGVHDEVWRGCKTRPEVLGIGPEHLGRPGPKGDDPLLGALAHHPQLTSGEVDVIGFEVAQLRVADSGAGEDDDGNVPDPAPQVARVLVLLGEAEQLTDLVLGERVDRRWDDPWPSDTLGRVRTGRVVEEKEVIEAFEGLERGCDGARLDPLGAPERHERPDGGSRRLCEYNRWLGRYKPAVVRPSRLRVAVLRL